MIRRFLSFLDALLANLCTDHWVGLTQAQLDHLIDNGAREDR